MSDLEKAAREAVEAQDNAQQLALIAAVLQAQQLVQQQQPVAQPAPVRRSSVSPAAWVGIGVGASVFLVTVAVSAVAVAISAVALTICVLVLRGMWADYRKGK
ncbi:hypothetical protein ACFWZY_16920 [Streptomyces sp. NPDC058992]|uniref:hypothetical protein n=1 Tax=Streptomyces sp. NPDC058992 TaxID=3346688 RepID=UPI00369E37B6